MAGVGSPDISKAPTEAINRSILNRTAVGTGASPESVRSAEAAKFHRAEVAKGKPAPGSAEAWAMGTTAPVELPKGTKAVDVITKNTEAGKPAATEAQNRETTLRALFEGNEAVLKTEFRNTQVYLIEPMRKVIHEMGADNILAELDAVGIDGWVDYMQKQLDEGRNPGEPGNFMDSLRSKYAEIINKERGGAGAADALKRDRDRLVLRQGEQDRAFEATERALEANRKKKESYGQKTKGSLGKKLADAEVDVQSGEAAYKVQQRELGSLEAQLAKKEQSLRAAIEHGSAPSVIGGLEGDISGLEGNIDSKKSAMEPYESKVAEMNKMIRENEGLDAERETLYRKSDALRGDIERFRTEITALEERITQAGESKEDFVKEFEGLVEAAFTDTMRKRLADEREGIMENYKKMADAESDPHIKAALLASRDSANVYGEWENKMRLKKGLIPFGRKEVKSFNKDLAEDHLRILEEEGPEAFVHELRRGHIDPDLLPDAEKAIYLARGEQALIARLHPQALTDPASADAAWFTSMMYTDAKLDTLTADKDFMEKAGAKAAGLLLKQAQEHNLLTPARMERLAEQLGDTEWGRAALDAALKSDEHSKAAVEHAEKGLGGKIVDFVKEKRKGALKNLLLLLMFGAFGPVAFNAIQGLEGGAAH